MTLQKESEWKVTYVLEENGFFEHIEKLKEISDGERKKEEWNDVLTDALKVIERVFSNRENEIAEEVEKFMPADREVNYHSSYSEGKIDMAEKVLQIIKH